MLEIKNHDINEYLSTLKQTLFTIYKDNEIYEIRSAKGSYDEVVVDKHGSFLGRKNSRINFYVFYKDSFESPEWLVEALKDFYSDPARFVLEDEEPNVISVHLSYSLSFARYLLWNEKEIKIIDRFNQEVEKLPGNIIY